MNTERFSCMTEAVDELTRRSPGLARHRAAQIIWDLDLGPIGSDRGIWIDTHKAYMVSRAYLPIG